MKTMKKTLSTLLLVCLFLGFTSCSDDDDGTITNPEPQSIADFVSSNNDYSLLYDALVYAELDATLDADGSYTVFAPDNDAFTEFLGGAALTDFTRDQVAQILLNHVLNMEVMASEITTGYVSTMATYKGVSDAPINMYLSTEDGVTINGMVDVEQTNLEFSNGIVHTVEDVIALPTIATFATADPTFSTLETALTADAGFGFVGLLSDPNGGPYTVFAPTDTAFVDLLTEQNVGSLTELISAIGIDGLETTLQYHVIAGMNVRASDLMDGTETTLGGDVTIDASEATITDDNGRTIEIIITDVQAVNGVIHAVNTVILPDMS